MNNNNKENTSVRKPTAQRRNIKPTQRVPHPNGEAGIEKTKTVPGTRYGKAPVRPTRRVSQDNDRTNSASRGKRRQTVSEKGLSYRNPLAVTKKEEKALTKSRREAAWQNSVERVYGGVDKIMLGIVLILLTLGAVMVYSASYPTSLEETGGGFAYLRKHLIFMAIGGVLMFTASRLPYTLFKKWGAFAAYGVAIVLLLLVLVMGEAEGEAKRWIFIGGFSIQPSEIMKVSLVLILAWYIDKYNDKMKNSLTIKDKLLYKTFYPLIFVGVACLLVLLEKHLSGTFIMALIGITVMLVGGCHVGFTLLTTVIGGGAAATLFIMSNQYARERLMNFFSDEVDTLNEGWQTAQGVLAIGSGGPFGVGFSESRQKFSYVPEAHNDFIFSIWCEELGFIGAVVLIVLFLVFVWRGYVIAMRAPDTFSMLTVFGITTQVGLQAFLNMMVVCDIGPNTGVSLPFFSYGGSSLIMLMAEMGLLLSISRHYYRKKIN